MTEKKTAVEVLLEHGQAYAKTSLRLFKFKATDKVADIVSNIASGFVILIFIAFLFINLNIGIALLIGDLLGKIWLGFMILSGFYTCMGLVVYIFRERWIKRPMSNSIIAQLLKEENFNNDELSD